MKSNHVIHAVCMNVLKVAVTILVIFVIYKGATLCYDYGYRIFAEPAVSTGEGHIVTVAITEEMSPWDIGEMFADKGLVRDGKLFALQYYLSEFRKGVKPGIFDLSTAMTAEEMMKSMAELSKEET